MANKYKLEGESKGISLGGLFRIIGWFILITASILLALNVYYWNASRQAEIDKINALQSVEQEISDNVLHIEEHIEALEAQKNQLNLLLASANRTVDSDSLLMATYSLYEEPQVQLNEGAFHYLNPEIISDLSISLKTMLVQFYKTDLQKLRQKESSIHTFIDEQLTAFLISEKNLSLVNPTLKTEMIRISVDQRNRIIRILLNNRSFIDLIYYRISQIDELISFERTILANATFLKGEVSTALEKSSL